MSLKKRRRKFLKTKKSLVDSTQDLELNLQGFTLFIQTIQLNKPTRLVVYGLGFIVTLRVIVTLMWLLLLWVMMMRDLIMTRVVAVNTLVVVLLMKMAAMSHVVSLLLVIIGLMRRMVTLR